MTHRDWAWCKNIMSHIDINTMPKVKPFCKRGKKCFDDEYKAYKRRAYNRISEKKFHLYSNRIFSNETLKIVLYIKDDGRLYYSFSYC
jgi:hypothetical protein